MEKFKIWEEVFVKQDSPYINYILYDNSIKITDINIKELKNWDKRYFYKIGYMFYEEKDLMSMAEFKEFLQETQKNIQNKIKQLD